MPTIPAILVTLLALILLPCLIRNALHTVFTLQMIYKHGLLFPHDSEVDKNILDHEASVWFDLFDNALRPFDWYYWMQEMHKNKK